MPAFKLASFNLYQYAEPGTFWYEAEETNDYEPDQWTAKQAFIRNTLAAMDADIVAFQEVFSRDSFADLVAGAGYPHLVQLQDAPFAIEDGQHVFKGPVNALASRFPILSAKVLPGRPGIEPDGLLAGDMTFRRGIIEAEIDVPGLPAPLVVYACHLKSQGAFVDKDAVAALPDWPARFREHMRQRMLFDANQVIRRTAEVMMLHHRVMERIEANPDQPIVVMGDLNDDPDSFALRILTQNKEIRNIAGRSYKRLENVEKSGFYKWQLYSVAALGVSQSLAQTPTHVGWSHQSVLDYILVSNSLNSKNPKALAEVTRYDVFNDHHWDGADRLLSSDHAPIRATVQIPQHA